METLNYHPGAIFTVELGSLVENGFDLGLGDYPIFDEEYRVALNNKIINHFWTREIGEETPALFKFRLNVRMREIMPYYNQLYKSALMEYDPFTNYEVQTEGMTQGESEASRDYTRDEMTNATAASTTNTDATSKGRTLVSATPQMQLSGHDDYATNITDSQTDSGSKGTSTNDSKTSTNAHDKTQDASNTTESYVTKVSGITGILKADAIMRFRDSFLNTDMLVVNDLNDLFMGLYTDYMDVL